MPKNKSLDASWEADFLIANAKSFQCVVTELEEHGSKSPPSDELLFSGVFLASPILLLLAIELALKAWLCQEQKRDPDRTHDLLVLFGSLEQETKELLGEGMPSFEPLRKILRTHRNAHTHRRYIHEKPRGEFHTGALKRALTVIINAYEKGWGDSASSSRPSPN